MKAIVITVHGDPEVLALTELPDPVPAVGEVLIRVRAFGLNHAETYMRSGAWGKVAQIPGIECAGTVQADPGGRLAAGTPVVAILGGMGRTRNGSYAELVTVPASNVVPVTTSLSWTDLAALPEVYSTAWAGLYQNLGLEPGGTVLVRGATASLGQAAVNVAADGGARVIATTRTSARTDLYGPAAGCASSDSSAAWSRWPTSTRSLTCPPASSSASTAARSCSAPRTSRWPTSRCSR
jgi:NADPH:quinone reductase